MWLRLIEPLDKIIDSITMYRLLLYYLGGLVLAAAGLSAVGVLHFSAISILISAIVLVFACWLINKILASIFNAPVNPESSILTGLILVLILPPQPTGSGLLFMLAASGLAMASKYLLTIKRKHIFNPAAVAVVLTALGPRQSASWWVGTASMLPFVIIGGLLLVRKIRRGQMVSVYLLATTIVTAVFSISGGQLIPNIKNMILTSSVFFLGFVMLTEPYTSPTTRTKQIWYAIIVGTLLAPQFHIGSYYPAPEMALIFGNLFAYLTGDKTKLYLSLFRKYKIAGDTAEFSFVTNQKFDYKPGQYMEFTLPHEKPDSRGVRRYFTMSSSPTEDHLKLGVKFYEPGSSYKAALLDIDQNSTFVGAQLAGDFVLPESDPNQKLLFIAGGIGITPFRSMIKYLIDKHERRDIILLYSVRSSDDLAYKELLDQAVKEIGLKVAYFITSRQAKAVGVNVFRQQINRRVLTKQISDLDERLIYISGTHPMVESMQELLHEIGIAHDRIKIDFFPGYA